MQRSVVVPQKKCIFILPNQFIMPESRHRSWVRVSHWLITISFLSLAFTGFEILMVHPRLYWGEVGNDLTPALIELPISRNYKHQGYEAATPFFTESNSPVSANRTYNIFNQNGWGRSLHFLSAWILVAVGLVYLLMGIFTGHFRQRLFPERGQFTLRLLWQDMKGHLRRQLPIDDRGNYNILQKYSYLAVIFLLLPLIVLTGLTMAPAIVAAFPFLLDLFGGTQSARTIHFFASFAVELFLIIHVIMVIRSGFKQQMRAMTIGK
jgi:thiosulfate reductase cytochrome b subunit